MSNEGYKPGGYLAYFCNLQSTPVDGWYDRVTVPCDSEGRLTFKSDWDRLQKWLPLGHRKIDEDPGDIWEKAKAK